MIPLPEKKILVTGGGGFLGRHLIAGLEALGWEPTVTFSELVSIMVDADIEQLEARLKGGAAALREGVVPEGPHS